jgi:4-hydroxybenzoate polyprenyltransferase
MDNPSEVSSQVPAEARESATRNYLEMIKIEHSIFALPFAMIGMVYAAGGWPGWRVLLLILLAMVSARSAAMAFNRIVDRNIDAQNPRTAGRHLPSGRLTVRSSMAFFVASCVLYFTAAILLNPLAMMLSPIPLIIMLGYSYTKRFTWLCHIVLGLSLGIAPAGAWVAVTGSFDWSPSLWILAVMCWTAGFDILYSLQDDEFDREHGLKSIPARFGRIVAIRTSRLLHVCAIIFMVCAGIAVGAGLFYFAGCVLAAALLTYEQTLVKPDDLRRIDMAFFTLNGYVSMGVFAFALIDVATRA